MKDLFIIKKYADSVIDVVPEKEYDRCLNDLKLLKKFFTGNDRIIEILNTKLVNSQIKMEFIDEFTQDLFFKDMWKKLIVLLINNARMKNIPGLLDEIERGIYKAQQTEVVLLKLARKQDKTTEDKILVYLEKVLTKKVKAEIEYDPAILGGFYAETEDKIVDGSLRNNLKKFVSQKPKKV